MSDILTNARRLLKIFWSFDFVIMTAVVCILLVTDFVQPSLFVAAAESRGFPAERTYDFLAGFAVLFTVDLYLYKLKHDKKTYEILDTFLRKDGSIIVRIVQQYYHHELIRLM